MKRILGRLKSVSFGRILLFFSLSLFILFCSSQHLPWRDEYQTFLVATRPHSFSEFWTAVRYERTPPLHYLILRYTWPLFENFLDPRLFIQWISLPFSFLTLWLFTFRFRFSLLGVFFLGLNLFFFREWGVISRSYALGGAFLFLSLDFYVRGKKEVSRVMLLASASTHLLFFAGCGALLFLEYFSLLKSEGSRFFRRWDFWLVAIIGGILFIQQIPPEGSTFNTHLVWPGIKGLFLGLFKYFAVIIFPLEHSLSKTWNWSWYWNHMPISSVFGLPALVFIFLAFREDKRIRFHLFFTISPILFIYFFGFSPLLRHCGVLYAFLLYFWIRHREMLRFSDSFTRKKIIFRDLLFTFGPAISTVYWLIVWNPVYPKFDFSDAPRIATLVAEAPRTLSPRSYLLFSAMAESGKSVFDLGSGSWISYPFFRTGGVPVSFSDLCNGKNNRIQIQPSDIFIGGLDEKEFIRNSIHSCPGWKQIYETDRKIATDESFIVFRYEPRHPSI